jgi:DNA-directed RNA polymerase subunit E'/Rpb7
MTESKMESKESMYKTVFIEQRISVIPSEIREASENMNEFLLSKIRDDLEGRCCIHGYVKPGSAQILAKSMGQAEHCRFTGDFMFICKVKISCLLPNPDQEAVVRIIKVNKIGVIALLVDENEVQEALRILIPRDLQVDNSVFDTLQEGADIRVKLLRSRFQTRDPFINVVAQYLG